MNNKDFKTRLKSAKKALLKNTNNEHDSRGHFMGSAFRLGTELVASVVVGTIIGFILDNWFGTKPWFIIIFFFLGVIAGILNVIRVANNIQKKD
tara:strand:- start:60 stop:341 length:282 start_codon:yes stop_codon:yes gene_type:complete